MFSALLLPTARLYLRLAMMKLPSMMFNYHVEPALPLERERYKLVIELSNVKPPLVVDIILEPVSGYFMDPPQPARRLVAGRAVYEYFLSSYVGENILRVHAVMADPMGLFHVERVLGHVVVRVAPKPVQPPIEALGVGLLLWLGGTGRLRGEEFLYLRPYMWGDEASRIDWKATARLGKLVSKETIGPGGLKIALLVAATSHEGERPNTPLEQAMRLALGLYEVFCRQGIQTRMLFLDGRGVLASQPCSPEALQILSSHRWEDAWEKGEVRVDAPLVLLFIPRASRVEDIVKSIDASNIVIFSVGEPTEKLKHVTNLYIVNGPEDLVEALADALRALKV